MGPVGPGWMAGHIPFRFNCVYEGGHYSAERSCGKCVVKKKLCGSQAIQAAHQKYREKAKERSKRCRNVRQAEKRKIRKKREVTKALNQQNRRAERVRERLKCDRQGAALRQERFKPNHGMAALHQEHHGMAALHQELILLHRAHVELASVTELEQQRWERECRQKRQQEQQELELLATMKGLIRIYKHTFAACGDR
jgi:hypothetical protein